MYPPQVRIGVLRVGSVLAVQAGDTLEDFMLDSLVVLRGNIARERVRSSSQTTAYIYQ